MSANLSKRSISTDLKRASGTRILIVDDDPRLLKTIRLVLLDHGCAQVDCAAAAAEAMDLVRLNPELALVDVGLGPEEPSGVDVVRGFRASGYDGFVCMLTGDDDADTMLRALLAGADDYLLKLCCNIGRDVEAMLVRHRSGPPPRSVLNPESHGRFLRSAGLTDEQVESLCSYAALGFPDNKELADWLGMSERATSKLVIRAEEKLGVENRGQLVQLLTVLSGYGVRDRLNRDQEGTYKRRSP
jgi:DNA-binding NarL/FixJ family response regulator